MSMHLTGHAAAYTNCRAKNLARYPSNLSCVLPCASCNVAAKTAELQSSQWYPSAVWRIWCMHRSCNVPGAICAYPHDEPHRTQELQ